MEKYVPNLIPEKARVKINLSELSKSQTENSDKTLYLVFGYFLLFVGFINLFSKFYVGLSFMMIGIVLIPAVHLSLEKLLVFKFNTKIKSFFIGFFVLIGSITLPGYITHENEIIAKQKAIQQKIELEKQQNEAAEHLRQQNESNFLAQHSFIKVNSYRRWLIESKDSLQYEKYTLSNYLKKEKENYIQHKSDSIQYAKTEKQKRIKEKQLAIKAEKARIRSEKQAEAAERAYNTYNGHTIHTGPRGGRYYINSNGRKTYIPH